MRLTSMTVPGMRRLNTLSRPWIRRNRSTSHEFRDAEFIWSDDLALDNTVIFRYRVEAPPDGQERLDFSNLTNTVPESPGRRGAGQGQRPGQGGVQRRGRDGEQRDQEPQDPPRRRGQQPQARGGDDTARTPWIAVHASEIDADEDGILTLRELEREAVRAFAGYDQDGDEHLSAAEYNGRSSARSAMSGFIREHNTELDGDGDGLLSSQEVVDTFVRMFSRADEDGDNRIEVIQSEVNNSRPRDEASRSRPSGSRLGGYEEPPPVNIVPAHPFDIILGRPTDDSVTACVLTYDDAEAFLAWGTERGQYTAETDLRQLAAGEAVDVLIEDLESDTRYYYRLSYRSSAAESFQHSDEYTFHTRRSPNSPFTFTVQSDSHLDENTSGDVYTQTLLNALSDSPDFHLALGDTFMTGKYVQPELALGQYLAQRYYLGRLCHSAPLYFALGNHDGESGSRGSNTWATLTRKQYFPNPFPDGLYTGNDREEPEIGLPENFYAWEWGNSQFIVLDPFRHTTSRSRGADNWRWTLGEAQYRWLRETLEASEAEFRFVFLHHLVGGTDRNSRGGIEASPFFEWGGHSLDGSYDFDRERPGWGEPIHQLLMEHGVSIVFHGHDHLYVQQELDGIVYQLVPQPGHFRFGNTRTAREYGYVNGVVFSSSGHLRVGVSDDHVRVDYVSVYLPESESADRRNGDVAHSYLIDTD